MTGATNSLAVAFMSEQADLATSWVHLVPSGTFYGIDGRGPYRLENADAVITASRAYAGKRKMVLDYEHQSINTLKNGKPAPAAGWIVGLQKRDNGIWGLVEWTDAAAQAVAKREYRYISPVFSYTPDGKVTAIKNAALTNSPNLDQLTALSRAEELPMVSEELAAKVLRAASLLGLPETSDQNTVLTHLREIATLAAEIDGLTGGAPIAAQSTEPDPTKFVPIGDFERVTAEYNKLNKGISVMAAREHVETQIRNGNMAPFLRDWGVSLCSVNKVAYDAFVTNTKGFFNGIVDGQMSGRPRPNPPRTRNSNLTETELEVCQRMAISEDDYKAAMAFDTSAEG